MARYTVKIPANKSLFVQAVSYNNAIITNNQDYLRAGGNIVINGDDIPRYALIIGFDYSVLPDITGKKLVSAILNYYAKTTVENASFNLMGYKANWTESSFNAVDLLFGNFTSVYPIGYVSESYSANTLYKRSVYQNELDNKSSLVLWRVYVDTEKIVDFYSTRAAEQYRPFIEVIYEDAPPTPPTLLDPIGVYKDSADVIRFSWKYNSPVGGNQKAFDFQWSTDQINWTSVPKITTQDTYYDMPANALPSGNIYWRVQTYNQFDEVSGFSDSAVFYSIGVPEAPSISGIQQGTANPLVYWGVTNQQIYQLQILQNDVVVYDKTVPSINDRQHKITKLLNDGQHLARIRIKNEYDIWSKWAEQQFIITTAKPAAPVITIYNDLYGALIKINPVNRATYYLVYRAPKGSVDYICIGQTSELSYRDYTGSSSVDYHYFIRAVTAAETFNDSASKPCTTKLKCSVVAPASNTERVYELKHSLNRRPMRNSQHELPSAPTLFAGRKHPIIEHSEHFDNTLNLDFYVRSYAELSKFVALYESKEMVLYRDTRGRKTYGDLAGLFVQEEKQGYTVSVLLKETDYMEGIEI